MVYGVYLLGQAGKNGSSGKASLTAALTENNGGIPGDRGVKKTREPCFQTFFPVLVKLIGLGGTGFSSHGNPLRLGILSASLGDHQLHGFLQGQGGLLFHDPLPGDPGSESLQHLSGFIGIPAYQKRGDAGSAVCDSGDHCPHLQRRCGQSPLSKGKQGQLTGALEHLF